jgi:3-oxoadipate enol-lactonase
MNSKNAFARMRMLALTVALMVLAGTAAAESTAGAFVTVEGGRVWYQTCGSGPKNIVLIHDGILHSASWDDVWPILCQDFHVVRYDRRGYGRSPATTVPYSPVADLEAVMQAAGLEHAVLVGSSAGAGLAVDFTLQHPAAVDRLVLSGPDVSGLAVSQYFIDQVTTLVQHLKKGDIDGALRSYRWAFAPGHLTAQGQAVALLTSSPQDIPQDIHDSDLVRHAPPARPSLPSIKAPTLILVGEYDIADVQGQAGALEALIPSSERIVVPDTGHLMYLEHPDVFAKLVAQFANGGSVQGTSLASTQAAQVHNEIAMDTSAKQAFVGQYQLAPNIILNITLDGDQLYAQATGQSRAAVFPESPTQLFLKVVNAQITFVMGADGKAASIVLHQNGHDIPGPRIN